VNPNNNIINTVAGTGLFGYNGDHIPANTAELNGPFGVAVDHNGNLYIADQGNSRIRKVDVTVGIPEINNSSDGINIYSNSSDGNFTIMTNLSKPYANSSIIFYDLSGQILFRKNIGNIPTGINAINFNTPPLASGIYFAELTAGGKHFMKRIIAAK
jgi:hypothetical protein